MNLLNLAEQDHAAFGRRALDDLLRQEIPDEVYEPSSLHRQLLTLPWRDVFTTNYDTLLERARTSVTLKHYDVVTKKEDLLYANQPRIVKLHGSFPSPPFVITEEDYRRYPSDHAPFVNTVRQSLLENTLCLIGFSGDDPNFLQWIGWIRDHIGSDTAPKIYLIGVFNTLNIADRQLLDRRGIVTLDLSEFSTDQGKALDAFLDYLTSRKPRAAEWPVVSETAPEFMLDCKPENLAAMVVEWRRQRSEYPGWVIMPEDRRRILWQHTEKWLSLPFISSSADRAGLETPLDLDLAFELTWRLDRCLLPLTEEQSTFLEEITTKYSDSRLRLPDGTDWTKDSVFVAIANIRLWLLRHYREDGLNEKWQSVREEVENDFGRLLPEHGARFRLEEVLHALFCFNPAEAKRLLMNWQSNDDLPFWEAKRAALMAELGETAAARSILETRLSAIRRQLSLKPVMGDYTLVSQESVAMLLLLTVERGTSATQLNSGDNNLLGEFSERWRELKQYGCDPRHEVELLSARLQHRTRGWTQTSTVPTFDIGVVTNTFHFGPDKEAYSAYELLRMYEEIGLPYRIEHITFIQQPVESTLLRLRPYSPHWAMVNITRLGNANANDRLFDREYLADLETHEVDRLFDIYLPALERTILMANEPDLSEARNFELLAKTLPDVFSRLCYKCSPENRTRLVDALRSIYGSKRRTMFDKVQRFSKRLFLSMSVEERVSAVPALIDFPVPDCLDEMEKQEFVNPLLTLYLPLSVQGQTLRVASQRIDDLLNQTKLAAQDREWALASLIWLHRQGELNEQQSERLAVALWDGVKASELPEITGFRSIVYMNLPHPEGINPEPRVKKHLLSIIEKQKDNTTGLADALDQLRHSAAVVQWSKADTLELTKKFSEWWKARRHLLHRHEPTPFGSPAKNTKHIIGKAVRALSELFLYLHVDEVSEKDIEPLRQFLADLTEHDIPTRVLEAAILKVVPDVREQVFEQLTAAMLDNDGAVVVDALWAAMVLAHVAAQEESHYQFAPVAAMLVQGVQWRHRPMLAHRLSLVACLVEKHPWFLSKEVLFSLLSGLEQLAVATSIGIKGNDVDGMIAVRSSAASLAFALFRHCHESGFDMPETIQIWRKICRHPNEFSEVKNSWKIAGG